ncbi:MAG: phosphoribosylformylglycinamidine cyclo-ligase [bacterium]
MKKTATYKSAGVDIAAGTESVKLIKQKVKSTFDKSVLSNIGTFGAMYGMKEILKKYKDPVLVQSIDSVGTKLKIATMMDKHDTIGEDMVSHSCGDILCQGAKPLTFLDYIAIDKVKPKQINEIVGGMVKGCREAGVSLIGGEIAELPGIYQGNEYDLVGSILGVVEKDKIINGSKIKSGNVLLGLPSSGLHTNGYSLARHIFFKANKYKVTDKLKGLKKSLGATLLTPHKNYTKTVYPLLDKFKINGIAHITGGGLIDNISRILPNGAAVEIKEGTWPILPIFTLMQELGNVPWSDMHKTFNLGIGMVLIVEKKDAEKIKQQIVKSKEKVYEIGEVVGGNGRVTII